jgi:hypothetical protein
VGAIGGPEQDASLVKFLAAYLRSPIATFLLIMTGYSVISERPRVAIEDIKAFPFCGPERHPDPAAARAIIEEVAEQFDAMAAVEEWQRDHAYADVSDLLDERVFDYFQLSESDRLLVRDMVRVVAASIQPQDYTRLTTPLLHRPTSEEIEDYVRILANELETSRRRAGGRGALEVEAVIDGAASFFGAIRVGLNHQNADHAGIARSHDAFHALLADIEAAFGDTLDRTAREDLFRMPNAMTVAGNAFYFIKPMRRRFWLARTALADADLITRTVQAAAWEKRAS